MNFQQLISFCSVLNEGSMTAAAEKLFLTQPAVSQQIRNLEDELGVDLLVRGVRQIRPTMQGQLLYDYARRIIHLTQQAEVAIQTIGEEIKGQLRIGTLNSLGLFLISPVVGLFLKHNSQLRLRLTYNSGKELLRELDEGLLDVVILPEGQSEFGVEPRYAEKKFLMKDEMWLVSSGKDVNLPRHIHFDEFLARPYVLLGEDYPRFAKLLRSEAAKRNVTLDPAFETSNVGTLKRVIESGLGWGFLPSHSIKKQVRTGRMLQIEVEELRYSVNLYYYTHESLAQSPSKDVFFRAIQQQINQ